MAAMRDDCVSQACNSQGTTPTAILDSLLRSPEVFVEATPFGGGHERG